MFGISSIAGNCANNNAFGFVFGKISLTVAVDSGERVEFIFDAAVVFIVVGLLVVVGLLRFIGVVVAFNVVVDVDVAIVVGVVVVVVVAVAIVTQWERRNKEFIQIFKIVCILRLT